VVLALTDGWAQRVRDATHGRGVDIVVDPIGGPAFDDAIRLLAIRWQATRHRIRRRTPSPP
jgi:NADPH2:quinone reductase